MPQKLTPKLERAEVPMHPEDKADLRLQPDGAILLEDSTHLSSWDDDITSRAPETSSMFRHIVYLGDHKLEQKSAHIAFEGGGQCTQSAP